MKVLLKTREIVKSIGGFRQHEDNVYVLDSAQIDVQVSGDIAIKIQGKRERHICLSEIVDMRFYC